MPLCRYCVSAAETDPPRKPIEEPLLGPDEECSRCGIGRGSE